MKWMMKMFKQVVYWKDTLRDLQNLNMYPLQTGLPGMIHVGRDFRKKSLKIDVDLRLMMMTTTMMKMKTPINRQSVRSEWRLGSFRSVFLNKETDPEKDYRELNMLFTP